MFYIYTLPFTTGAGVMAVLSWIQPFRALRGIGGRDFTLLFCSGIVLMLAALSPLSGVGRSDDNAPSAIAHKFWRCCFRGKVRRWRVGCLRSKRLRLAETG